MGSARISRRTISMSGCRCRAAAIDPSASSRRAPTAAAFHHGGRACDGFSVGPGAAGAAF